jgi:predicted enzyme related to lactoylglutathione lyase
MTSNLAHFAINADDVATSRSFYESVFGWTFHPWGPPGFYRILTGPGGIEGALHQRRPLGGRDINGFECTFAVDDVRATARAIREAGGTIVLEPFTIAGVGHLIFFTDPGGNTVGAMQYDDSAG